MDSTTFNRRLAEDWDRSFARNKATTTRSTTIHDCYPESSNGSVVLDEKRTSTPTKLPRREGGFSSLSAEIGFCAAIFLSQFVTEYLITGFAIELPHLLGPTVESTGLFWPACMLTLVLSAFLLVFARISDRFGGYFPFVAGVAWLAIWSTVAAFVSGPTWVSVCRANQGLAIAAFTPSVFTMVGAAFPDARRKNLILGIYAGCAPLGFFSGFLAASMLPASDAYWYFLIVAFISAMTSVLAYFTVPCDETDRTISDLHMDWTGSFFIIAGLLLVSYGLAVIPYHDSSATNSDKIASPEVLGPLLSGLVCLIIAVWIEGWLAHAPLLPFAFFRSREVQVLSLATLFLYASYGVWLYASALFLQSPIATGLHDGIQGAQLALYYTPTAIGGLVLCLAGGALLHIVKPKLILFISGLAWVAAPLLFALGPTPVDYWRFVMPSMLCATLGIDLTFTVSIVCITRAQPAHYQGLAGAICSVLMNLAISFSLPISEIISNKVERDDFLASHGLATKESIPSDDITFAGFQAMFLYAAASAGVGLVLVVLYICIPSRSASSSDVDESSEQRKKPEESRDSMVSWPSGISLEKDLERYIVHPNHPALRISV